MVEINPFAEDNKGNFVCLDAKLKFDDNADFRQKAVFDQRDWTQEDAREVGTSIISTYRVFFLTGPPKKV